MKIKLTQGKYALIDDNDYDKVKNIKWHFDGKYAANKNRIKTYLHRFILNTPKGVIIDHKDRDKLNCQRANLRETTNQLNQANRKMNKNNTSGFKGVHFNKQKKYKKPWVAMIKVDYKNVYLGIFKDPKEAALAYNLAASRYFGNFAVLNKI